jgi:hypothetical protein
MKHIFGLLLFILTFSAGLLSTHKPAEPHTLCYEQLKLAPMEMDEPEEWQRYEREF